MAESAIAKKLKLKPGQRAAVLAARGGYLAQPEPLQADIALLAAVRPLKPGEAPKPRFASS